MTEFRDILSCIPTVGFIQVPVQLSAGVCSYGETASVSGKVHWPREAGNGSVIARVKHYGNAPKDDKMALIPLAPNTAVQVDCSAEAAGHDVKIVDGWSSDSDKRPPDVTISMDESAALCAVLRRIGRL